MSVPFGYCIYVAPSGRATVVFYDDDDGDGAIVYPIRGRRVRKKMYKLVNHKRLIPLTDEMEVMLAAMGAEDGLTAMGIFK